MWIFHGVLSSDDNASVIEILKQCAAIEIKPKIFSGRTYFDFKVPLDKTEACRRYAQDHLGLKPLHP